jgi:hypothetical protein
VLKFRSMYTDQCDPTARAAVTKGDPRVTKVGRFIRKTSIDELPQFFNVLRGDLVAGRTRGRMRLLPLPMTGCLPRWWTGISPATGSSPA